MAFWQHVRNISNMINLVLCMLNGIFLAYCGSYFIVSKKVNVMTTIVKNTSFERFCMNCCQLSEQSVEYVEFFGVKYRMLCREDLQSTQCVFISLITLL